MTTEEDIQLRIADWTSLSKQAHAIRHEVFVREQGVPEEMELDAFDEQALHVLVLLSSPQAAAIATGRLVTQTGEYLTGVVGRIGRLAVLPAYRGRGVGHAMLLALLQEGQARGLTQFELHAQLTASPWYEQYGFVAQGAVFNEAGIDHILMVRAI